MPIKLAAASFFMRRIRPAENRVDCCCRCFSLRHFGRDGQFEIMKESVAAITPDRRLQLLLVAFCLERSLKGPPGLARR